MRTSRHHEITGAIIIDTLGRFLLQQRDDVSGIVHPGKISLFGGHREGHETYLQCAVREVHEEISHYVSPDRFEYLITYHNPDSDAEGGTVRGKIFIVRNVPVYSLRVTEGSLLIIEPDKLAAVEHNLTPFARFAMKAFLDKQATKTRQHASGRTGKTDTTSGASRTGRDH